MEIQTLDGRKERQATTGCPYLKNYTVEYYKEKHNCSFSTTGRNQSKKLQQYERDLWF